MQHTREIRDYVAQVFKVPRTGISEVRDQEVISDGHTYDDLKVITLDAMCDYIGSRETFARAWEITCAKAYSELYPPVGVVKSKQDIADEAEFEKKHVHEAEEPLVGEDGKPFHAKKTKNK